MVLLLEIYLILVYACACFLLYGRTGDDKENPFRELDWSFIYLFALSTTVNDPDIWLPLYSRNRWNALVFISFLLVNLYFIHNLVIATIYDVYSSSLSQYTQNRQANRSSALESAFLLMADRTHAVDKETIMAVFRILRSHYSEAKLQVLYEVVDPEEVGKVPKDSFYLILDALNRRVRSRDPPAGGWIIFSNMLLALNACFVIGICFFHTRNSVDTNKRHVPRTLVITMVLLSVFLFLDTAQQVTASALHDSKRCKLRTLLTIFFSTINR